MKNLELNVIRFEAEDVIATSAKIVTISGLADGIDNNLVVTINGVRYSGATDATEAIRTQCDGCEGREGIWITNDGTNTKSFTYVANYYDTSNRNKATVSSRWNRTFYYENGEFREGV